MDRLDSHVSDDGPVLTAEDIEAAYERALRAVEAVEGSVAELAAAATTDGDPVPLIDDDPNDVSMAPSDAAGAPMAEDARAAPVLHPREIIEAALFVGGRSLTTKRLGHMLGGNDTTDRIDGYIAELNTSYRDEERPYRIDFGEGGYRLVLLPDFEPVRNSVFGAGPKEVKLTQPVLEVLAIIAYRQPATQRDVESAGRDNVAGHVRQLLRRGLIALERSADGEVMYSTTPRFLEVFGLRSLDDLPLPEDLELK